MTNSSDHSMSGMLGWVSIACWLVVYSPQIIENYRRKSGEGLSVFFVLIWLTGDLFNLVGAVMARLLPTVIILAIYYSICDLILLFQIYFYRWTQNTAQPTSSEHEGEELPLLDARIPIVSTRKILVRYAAAAIFVFATGMVAWWMNNGGDNLEDSGHPEWTIQIMGWSSAVLYLGARIPQILKNFKTRCEGLSPALFFFAILGNTTYALSICAASLERNYLIMNASWLAGSILTTFLDVAVLCQFFYYRSVDSQY